VFVQRMETRVHRLRITMRIIAIRVLRQRDCTSIIRSAKRRLDNNERYRTDHLAYQRQL
jgi:hypothetical protein